MHSGMYGRGKRGPGCAGLPPQIPAPRSRSANGVGGMVTAAGTILMQNEPP